MPNTANRTYPYPARGDLSRYGWRDIQQLAEAVDVDVATQVARIAVLEAAGVYRAQTTLAGTTASVTFSGISSALSDLCIKYTARGTQVANSVNVCLRINSDSTAVYDYNAAQFANGAVGSDIVAGATFIELGPMPAASATAGVFGGGVIDIIGWDSPHSTYLTIGGRTHAYIPAVNAYVTIPGGHYRSAGPYTSVTLIPEFGSFAAGSQFDLYGYTF